MDPLLHQNELAKLKIRWANGKAPEQLPRLRELIEPKVVVKDEDLDEQEILKMAASFGGA